jgi:tetratricopeptide (TPR) repeat protein
MLKSLKKKMNKIPPTLIIFILFVCQCSPNKETLEAKNEKNQYADVIEQTNGLATSPKNFPLLIQRGIALTGIGRCDKALILYKEMLQKDGVNTKLLFLIAESHFIARKFIDALRFCNKSIDSKGTENIFIEQVDRDEYDFDDFDVAMEEIRLLRGQVYYYLDSLAASNRDYDFCLRHNFKLPAVHYYRSFLFKKLGMKDSCYDELSEAARLGFDVTAKELSECK